MLPRGRLPPVAGFFSRAALRTVSIHDIKGYASASVAECGGLINKKGLEEKIAVQRWAISLTTSNRARRGYLENNCLVPAPGVLRLAITSHYG